MSNYFRNKEFWKKREKNKKIATELPEWYSDLERRYIEAMCIKNNIEETLSELREELFSHMKDDKLDKIITDFTEVYIIHEYNGRKVDTNKLKHDYPDIFLQCSKPYTMNEHLQVTVSKKNNTLND
jgi:hypothetical protein